MTGGGQVVYFNLLLPLNFFDHSFILFNWFSINGDTLLLASWYTRFQLFIHMVTMHYQKNWYGEGYVVNLT